MTPTQEPSVSPTLEPTAVPTAQPTTDSTTVIKFVAFFNISTVSTPSLSDAGVSAVQRTLASISDVQETEIFYGGIVSSISRTLSKMLLRVQLNALSKTAAADVWDLRIVVEFLVSLKFYPDLDPAGLYNRIRNRICSSIDDGSLATLLRQNARALGAFELYDAGFPVGSCAVGSYTETNGQTNSAAKTDDTNLSSGITALVIIATILGLILLCCVCFFGISYYKEHEEEKSQDANEENNRNTSMYSVISYSSEEPRDDSSPLGVCVHEDREIEDRESTSERPASLLNEFE